MVTGLPRPYWGGAYCLFFYAASAFYIWNFEDVGFWNFRRSLFTHSEPWSGACPEIHYMFNKCWIRPVVVMVLTVVLRSGYVTVKTVPVFCGCSLWIAETRKIPEPSWRFRYFTLFYGYAVYQFVCDRMLCKMAMGKMRNCDMRKVKCRMECAARRWLAVTSHHVSEAVPHFTECMEVKCILNMRKIAFCTVHATLICYFSETADECWK